MKTVSFQVSDEVYEGCRRMAAKCGKTVEECVLDFLVNHGPKPRPKLTKDESQAAWKRLRRHFGAVNSGDPDSADNDRIDADLAREYGRGLGEQN
jgi:hypothetical protein